MKRVSISELAEALKVSKTLVSLVLNGKGDAYGINAETQKRVMRKAKQMNYQPNLIARGLRQGRSNVIGVVVADISNPFYSHISKSIEEYASKNGYNIIVCNTDEDAEKENSLIDSLVNGQNVAGLVVATTSDSATQLLALQKNNFPVVLIDRKAGAAMIDYVGVDNFRGAFEATEHLVKSGYRKIGLLKITPSHLSTIKERTKGFEAALKKHRIRIDKKLIHEIEFSKMKTDVRKAMKSLLKRESGADAVFVLNSNIAAYTLEYINENNVRVPEEIAIVCFDDAEFFRFSNPTVTAVAQPLEEIGTKAAELIVQRLSNARTQKISNTALTPKLIVRKSSQNA